MIDIRHSAKSDTNLSRQSLPNGSHHVEHILCSDPPNDLVCRCQTIPHCLNTSRCSVRSFELVPFACLPLTMRPGPVTVRICGRHRPNQSIDCAAQRLLRRRVWSRESAMQRVEGPHRQSCSNEQPEAPSLPLTCSPPPTSTSFFVFSLFF
jgi:hypothetical protein